MARGYSLSAHHFPEADLKATKKIVPRLFERRSPVRLGHLHPILQKVYSSRGITSEAELDRSLSALPSPWGLSGMDDTVRCLQAGIEQDKRLLIVADFDADGATSCALAITGLRLLGAKHVSYIVPNRFEYGYGLTPEIVVLAHRENPDILITVDNGISSIDGVDAANQRGIKVLITDHHLPGAELPAAHAIVNPNLPGESFPSRAPAGVGVMFYVLTALRSRLRDGGWFARTGIPEPNLADLLDLVALGTIADVVPLDHVNRILVHQGLQRIRSGRARAGIRALIDIAGRNVRSLTASDLGFAVGPRLNAAGRLEDMSLGIETLLAETMEEARVMAARLDALNTERRDIEEAMKRQAVNLIKDMKAPDPEHLPFGVCLYDAGWHQGVVGILASRIKDRLHRPVIAFAPVGEGELKGSGRSVPGVHIRDVLSNIAAEHPGLLKKFGGHAMAAGLSLHLSDYPAFSLAFDRFVRQHLQGVQLAHTIYSDGQLADADMTLDFAELLRKAGPWGHGFPEPAFDGEFEVVHARIVGRKHLKMVIRPLQSARSLDAIAFFVDEPESWLGMSKVRLVYRLDINEFRDNRSVQLVAEYLERADNVPQSTAQPSLKKASLQ